MAVIKNKRELVLRAKGHARADHVQQGTYGRASVNGYADFKGCAIGCLATPHRQPELRKFLRDLFKGPVRDRHLEDAGLDEYKQQELLKREFGICPALARAAESFFESQRTHGAAIEFIPAFAMSLPEGRNVTQRTVASVLRKAFRGRGYVEPDVEEALNGTPLDVSEDETRRFLDGLKALA